MKTVFKYPLTVRDYVEIPMPEGAEILAVQTQHGIPCLWARVDTERPDETRHFRISGTGHELSTTDEPLRYVGTFQLQDGIFVGHLFERTGGE